ncbi:hypothetical protein PHPALM_13317 [Phytophthora palmivora]|uniref:Uncharacterized protein n=1 Tax=Phytophthora palmivora TaxID=4796 RepID=A0A2P4XXG9_9STRA|nr:hypothetical protein PHPALM_13317 [Phytophthora palmivora]
MVTEKQVSMEFSQTLCDLLLEADDVMLVNLFFTKRLSSLEEKAEPYRYTRETGDSSIAVSLQILDGLDDGPAKQALLSFVVKNTVNLRTERLCSSKALGSLWKWTIRSADKCTIDTLGNKFTEVDPIQLRPVTDAISQNIGDVDASDEKFIVLASITTARIKWLKNQVQGRPEKSFTWEMPSAAFPDNARIQAFLRGPEQSITTTGVRVFSGLPAARKYANNAEQINCSFTMEPAGRGKDAYVKITKTRTWFNKQYGDTGMHTELKLLIDRFGDATTEEGPAPKRARTKA